MKPHWSSTLHCSHCKDFSASSRLQIFWLSWKMVQAKLSYQCLRLSLNQYVNIISVPPRLYVKIMDDLHALVASMWVHLGVRYWLHIPHQKMGSWHTHGNMGVNHTNVQLSTCQNTSWVYVAKKGSIAKIFVSSVWLKIFGSSRITAWFHMQW